MRDSRQPPEPWGISSEMRSEVLLTALSDNGKGSVPHRWRDITLGSLLHLAFPGSLGVGLLFSSFLRYGETGESGEVASLSQESTIRKPQPTGLRGTDLHPSVWPSWAPRGKTCLAPFSCEPQSHVKASPFQEFNEKQRPPECSACAHPWDPGLDFPEVPKSLPQEVLWPSSQVPIPLCPPQTAKLPESHRHPAEPPEFQEASL
jgi:hypothetical protein